jgi:two-component system chemotaxis sensor kinase CheA
VVVVRGELIPYIDLRAAFQVEGTAPEIEKVVIVHHGDDRVGLVVDRVLGTHQTVLQPLGKFLRNIEVVSGATIMGDGRVALILDISAVVQFVGRQVQQTLFHEIEISDYATQEQLTNVRESGRNI